MFRLALADHAGSVPLYTNRLFGNSGSSILETNPVIEGCEKQKIEVPCTALDAFFQALRIAPTTVKLDIEGAEDLALSGGTETIGRKGVKVLLEIHHAYLERRGKDARTVLRMLADLGKSIHFLENGEGYPYKLMEKMDPARAISVPNFHVIAMD